MSGSSASIPPGSGDTRQPVLRLAGISKAFAGVQALEDVSLDLYAGEITGLLGANGAGKSTLVKILSGAHRQDHGVIWLNGSEVSFASPRDAIRSGIATVYQESSLVPNLDVAENVVLGQEPPSAGGLFVSSRRVHARAKQVLDEQGFDLPLRKKAEALSVAERQLTEIARALSLTASILIMDEPTAALAQHEAEELFDALRRVKTKGVPVVYITHRLEEVPLICDRVVVLRDGRLAGQLAGTEISRGALISMMVGREIVDLFPEPGKSGSDVVLEVRRLATPSVTQASFTLRRGEILGLTGLLGAGQRDIARALFGVAPRSHGSILLEGSPIPPNRPEASAASGLGYVSGDRREGVIAELDLLANLTLASLGWLSRFGFIRRRRERAVGDRLVIAFGIRTTGLRQRMSTLSGGNQQKALLARWATQPPKVLILDEPTLGVDVGARQEIYRLVRKLTDDGSGVLLVSSDLDEVLGMSDRLMVFSRGKVVAEVAATDATKEQVLAWSLAQSPETAVVPVAALQ